MTKSPCRPDTASMTPACGWTGIWVSRISRRAHDGLVRTFIDQSMPQHLCVPPP